MLFPLSEHQTESGFPTSCSTLPDLSRRVRRVFKWARRIVSSVWGESCVTWSLLNLCAQILYCLYLWLPRVRECGKANIHGFDLQWPIKLGTTRVQISLNRMSTRVLDTHMKCNRLSRVLTAQLGRSNILIASAADNGGVSPTMRSQYLYGCKLLYSLEQVLVIYQRIIIDCVVVWFSNQWVWVTRKLHFAPHNANFSNLRPIVLGLLEFFFFI